VLTELIARMAQKSGNSFQGIATVDRVIRLHVGSTPTPGTL
jgi:hypothetical protein